jgi:phage protein U
VFAILGDIPFEMVGSPEAFNDSRVYDYAEYRVIQARPRLQWLADDLIGIRLQMLLHRSYSAPAARLFVLQQAGATHAALPLIFGNGDFRGYFVITRIDTVSRQMSSSGDIIAITVSLSLRESPFEFDPAAVPTPSFVPIALAAATISGSRAAPLLSTGVSALVALTAPSGPPSSLLLADDVPTSAIVRSAI